MAVPILIADDHSLVRDGLRMNIEAQEDFKVVGEAINGREALTKAVELRPSVIIMDIAMPDMNGIEATSVICERLPGIKVLILSMYCSLEHSFRALHAGATGYLLKESAGDEVVMAVRTIMKGRYFFGAGVPVPLKNGGTEHYNRHKSPLESLSHREREVLQFVVEGKSSTEIATLLTLSSKSVDTYRSRLMHKLGITNIPSLVSFALKHGIIPP